MGGNRPRLPHRCPRAAALRACNRLLLRFEAGQALGFLLEDLDTLDLGAARALLAEADEGFHRFRLALEHCLESPVRPVTRPTGESAGLRRPGEGVPKPNALNAAVHDDASAHHYRASNRIVHERKGRETASGSAGW